MDYIKFLGCLLIISTHHIKATPYQVMIEPLWHEISVSKIEDYSREKWVVIGKITLKHTTRETIKLDSLSIAWQGNQIDQLFGSLYRADITDMFLPIESYLVADSIWSEQSQKMYFSLEKPLMLEPATTFYLVLAVPLALEKDIKTGSFFIVQESLPREFKYYAQSNKTDLTFSSKIAHSYNPLKMVSSHRS